MDNSSFVGYTSANQEVMDELASGDYEGIMLTYLELVMIKMKFLNMMKQLVKSFQIISVRLKLQLQMLNNNNEKIDTMY